MRGFSRFLSLALILGACVAVIAESKNVAPIPTAIVSAKKIFISNAGQEPVPGLGNFSGDCDRTYNQFYAAVKAWGQYELVPSPAEADLIFEISFALVPGGNHVFHGDSVGAQFLPHLKLVILDPKTHFTLWAFTEHVDWAILAGNRNKNFNQGMDNLVADLKKLTG